MSVTFVIDGGGNFAEEMEKNRKAQDNLYRDKIKWLNAIKTPEEKHLENVARLEALLKKQAISDEQFGRAKLLSLQKMNAELDRHIIKAEAVADKQDKLKLAIDSQLSSLTQTAAGWAGVAMAIQSAGEAMEAYNRAAASAATDKQTAHDAIGNLQQLSGGDPKEFAKLVASARDYRLKAGLGEGKSAEAYQTINDLANTGMLDKANLFAEMRGSRMISDVGSVIQGASAIQFNAAGAGDITNILATSLAASGTSSKNIEPIMGYMGKVASAAQPLGLSFNESAALMSVGATSVGSAERGSEMMSSLLNEVVAKGVYKPGMSVDQLVEANKGTQFGSVASQGYRTLTGAKGRADMKKALDTIALAQANPEKYLLESATSGARSNTPEGRFIEAQRNKERAEAALSMKNEGMADRQIQTQAAVTAAKASSTNGTVGSVWGADLAAASAEYYNLGPFWGGIATQVGAMRGKAAQEAAVTGVPGTLPVVTALRAVANAIGSQPKAPPLPSVSP